MEWLNWQKLNLNDSLEIEVKVEGLNWILAIKRKVDFFFFFKWDIVEVKA